MKIKQIGFLLIFLISILQAKAQNMTGKQALEDIDFLVKNIKDAHANPYLHISEADWNTEIERYKQKYQAQNQVELAYFALDMKKLLARLQDAHSGVSLANQELRQYPDSAQFFPFIVKINEMGDLQVDDKTLLSGKTILKINGQDAKALYEEALSLQAGTMAFKRYYTSQIYFPVLLYLKNIRMPFEITMPQESHKGFPVSIKLPLADAVSLRQLSERLNSREQAYTLSFPKTDVALISYNQCENYKGFKVFLDSTFRLLEQKNIEKLIIDIRYNSGGNSALNDLLLPYITQKAYRQSSGRHWKVSQAMKERINQPLYREAFGKKFIKQYKEAKNATYLKEDEYPLTTPQKPKHFFEGKTCVLMGTQTFSSANFLADAIKTYQLSTLIGEPTGELTNDFGELIVFEMPHSKLEFGCSVAYDIGADGNAEKIEAVLPDIAVEGDALEYALEWLEK